MRRIQSKHIWCILMLLLLQAEGYKSQRVSSCFRCNLIALFWCSAVLRRSHVIHLKLGAFTLLIHKGDILWLYITNEEVTCSDKPLIPSVKTTAKLRSKYWNRGDAMESRPSIVKPQNWHHHGQKFPVANKKSSGGVAEQKSKWNQLTPVFAQTKSTKPDWKGDVHRQRCKMRRESKHLDVAYVACYAENVVPFMLHSSLCRFFAP